MSSIVKTAVIPVAGSGSRIRPLSLVTPKEMLATPFGPIIELVTNELIDAGIERIIYVTKPGKELIKNHLEVADLHQHPQNSDVTLEFINQSDIPGNGGAILTAVDECKLSEPFIVVWGDEVFIKNESAGRASELINAYKTLDKPCIMLTEVSNQDIPKCGMAKTEPIGTHESRLRITDLIEKPEIWDSENNYASVGGYIVTHKTITYLRNASMSGDGELYLSQAISDYLHDHNELYGILTECEWHETGTMEGYISTFEALARRRKVY